MPLLPPAFATQTLYSYLPICEVGNTGDSVFLKFEQSYALKLRFWHILAQLSKENIRKPIITILTLNSAS